jgi:hypothetical protein
VIAASAPRARDGGQPAVSFDFFFHLDRPFRPRRGMRLACYERRQSPFADTLDRYANGRPSTFFWS